jgi:hypothetical protein
MKYWAADLLCDLYAISLYKRNRSAWQSDRTDTVQSPDYSLSSIASDSDRTPEKSLLLADSPKRSRPAHDVHH